MCIDELENEVSITTDTEGILKGHFLATARASEEDSLDVDFINELMKIPLLASGKASGRIKRYEERFPDKKPPDDEQGLLLLKQLNFLVDEINRTIDRTIQSRNAKDIFALAEEALLLLMDPVKVAIAMVQYEFLFLKLLHNKTRAIPAR